MTASPKSPREEAPEARQPQSTAVICAGQIPTGAYGQNISNLCSISRNRQATSDEVEPVFWRCDTNGLTCHKTSVTVRSRMSVVPHSSSLRGSDEHQAFQFFMEKTMTWFDLESGKCILEHVDGFWNPVVLQFTESEPAIKHILLAWAELHRQVLHGPCLPNEPFENAFFWQNHNQALRLLGTSKQIDTSVILIACIMFCILENFRGRREVFLKHLQSGMRILNHYDKAPAQMKSSICDDLITRYIRPIFRAFQQNLPTILEQKLVRPREKIATKALRLRPTSRPIKTWN